MSVSPLISASSVARPRRGRLLLAGPKFPVMCLTALPAGVVALASVGAEQQVSGIIAIGWLALAPMALYERWAAIALPIVAAGFLLLVMAALPFNSAAFIVDAWTTLAMIVLALPRRSPQKI
jgi:hypothetical protein